jgi:hypothetical protein
VAGAPELTAATACPRLTSTPRAVAFVSNASCIAGCGKVMQHVLVGVVALRSRTRGGRTRPESRIIGDLDGAAFQKKLIDAEALGLEGPPWHEDFAADAVAKCILVLEDQNAHAKRR